MTEQATAKPDSQVTLDEAPKPSLGVLFVHGIGEQRRGGTVTTFGDPLYRYLCRWLSADERVERDRNEQAVEAGELLYHQLGSMKRAKRAVAAMDFAAEFLKVGNTGGAQKAYEEAIKYGEAELRLKAVIRLGQLMAEEGDIGGARRAGV
jgi:hypothetical protein